MYSDRLASSLGKSLTCVQVEKGAPSAAVLQPYKKLFFFLLWQWMSQ